MSKARGAVAVVWLALAVLASGAQGASKPPRLHTDFFHRKSGPIAAGDEGVSFVMRSTTDSTRLRIVGGTLTFGDLNPDRGIASYAQQRLSAPTAIGASFRFRSGEPNGSAALVLWANLIPTPYAVPDSPLHFVITPRNWIFGIWQSGKFSQLLDRTFTKPLAQDDHTAYTASATINRSTVTLKTPDGRSYTVTDPRIGRIGRSVACWEVYTNKAGESVARYIRGWAN